MWIGEQAGATLWPIERSCYTRRGGKFGIDRQHATLDLPFVTGKNALVDIGGM